jgi:hypothetical protein
MFRSVLAEVADGIRSTAEGDLRDVIRVNRLPMPLFNPSLYLGDLFLGKPDACGRTPGWPPKPTRSSGTSLPKAGTVPAAATT